METIDTHYLNEVDVSFVNDKSLINVYWARIAQSFVKEPIQRFEGHTHSFFEILFLCEGESRYECNNKQITIKQGQYMIVPPKVKHTLKENSEPFFRLVVAFDIDKNSDLYENFIIKQDLLYNMTPAMNNNIGTIIENVKLHGMFYDIIISRRLEELVYLVIEQVMEKFSLRVKGQSSDVRFLQAKKYIMDNPDKFFTCTDVANYCYISAKQLGRLFEKYENMSLFDFIHDRKLKEIKILLLKTSLSQRSISEKLGFSSPVYYNKFFRKKTGMSPEKYRLKYGDVLDNIE